MGDRIAGQSIAYIQDCGDERTGNELIAKVMMFPEGFKSAKIMEQRIVALCLLSRQLLSAQQHHEWPFAETHLVSRRTVAAGPQAQSRWPEPVFLGTWTRTPESDLMNVLTASAHKVIKEPASTHN